MANICKITGPDGITYDIRDSNLNGHTVLSDVPSEAKFTDTTYGTATTSSAGLMSASDKTKLNNFSDINNASLLRSSNNDIAMDPLLVGSNYANYGNCYYYKIGTKVHIHIGVQGLTSGTNNHIYTLPAGYIPKTQITFVGAGSTTLAYSLLMIDTYGRVRIYPSAQATHASIDGEYDAYS